MGRLVCWSVFPCFSKLSDKLPVFQSRGYRGIGYYEKSTTGIPDDACLKKPPMRLLAEWNVECLFTDIVPAYPAMPFCIPDRLPVAEFTP